MSVKSFAESDFRPVFLQPERYIETVYLSRVYPKSGYLAAIRSALSEYLYKLPYLGRVRVRIEYRTNEARIPNGMKLLPILDEVCQLLTVAGVVYDVNDNFIERVMPVARPYIRGDFEPVILSTERFAALTVHIEKIEW